MKAMVDAVTMTKYSTMQGIKEFGATGTDTILQELKQLHERESI